MLLICSQGRCAQNINSKWPAAQFQIMFSPVLVVAMPTRHYHTCNGMPSAVDTARLIGLHSYQHYGFRAKKLHSKCHRVSHRDYMHRRGCASILEVMQGDSELGWNYSGKCMEQNKSGDLMLLYYFWRCSICNPFHQMDGSVHHNGTTYLPGNGYQYIGESNEAFKKRLEDEDH